MRVKKSKVMFLLITAVLTGVIIIIDFIIYKNEYEELKEHAYDMGQKFVDHGANTVENYIDEHIVMANTIASNESVREMCIDPQNEQLRNEVTHYLEETAKIYPSYVNIPIVVFLNDEFEYEYKDKLIDFKYGTVLVDSAQGNLVGENGLKFGYVKPIIAGSQFYISEVHYSELNRQHVFVVSVPIYNNEELIGVSIIALNMAEFARDHILDFYYKESGYLTLNDDGEIIIAHKRPDFNFKYTKNISKEVGRIGEKVISGETRFSCTFEGNEKIYVAKSLGFDLKNSRTQWYISYTQQIEEIMEPMSKFLTILISISIIVFILLYLIIWLIFRRFEVKIEKVSLKHVNKNLERRVSDRTHELRRMTNIDGLTNLYRKNTFVELLNKKIEKSEVNVDSISLAMLDLDFFKRVNDKYGHIEGDKVLRVVSKCLRENIGKDGIVGRYCGEEFIIMFSNITYDEAISKIEKIRSVLENTEIMINEEIKINVTASFGITSWNGQLALELIRIADKMLYRAKENGRNRIEK